MQIVFYIFQLTSAVYTEHIAELTLRCMSTYVSSSSTNVNYCALNRVCSCFVSSEASVCRDCAPVWSTERMWTESVQPCDGFEVFGVFQCTFSPLFWKKPVLQPLPHTKPLTSLLWLVISGSLPCCHVCDVSLNMLETTESVFRSASGCCLT